MDEIWGLDSTTDERTVDVHVNRRCVNGLKTAMILSS